MKDKVNPWLAIPAAEYEAHMGSPEVGQLQFLNAVFKEVLARRRPSSLLVPGCATGNGFEHIDFAVTKRVVAVDINPEYLSLLNKRFPGAAPRVETIARDILACEFPAASFDLIFAGLVFEYLDASAALARFRGWLKTAGVLAVVLQLPDDRMPAVTETPFTSLKTLASVMMLLTAKDFDETAARHGLFRTKASVQRLTSGKRLYVADYSPRDPA